MPIKASVANAVSTAKRCNQRLSGIRFIRKAQVQKQTAASGGPQRFSNQQDYLTSSLKSTLVPPSFTSTSFSIPVGAALRCRATILYLPAGAFLIVNFPFLSVTAK